MLHLIHGSGEKLTVKGQKVYIIQQRGIGLLGVAYGGSKIHWRDLLFDTVK